MRVPIRKPGQYTHYQPDRHITASKLQAFKDELVRLKKTVRPHLASEVKRLAELGDFSENAEYQIAKGRLRGINDRIQELEDAVSKAVVITQDSGSGSIQIGSTVTLEMDGKRKTFTILGSAESDPAQGVISHTSPIGAALRGRRAGERFMITLANKEVQCRIIEVG